MTGSSFPVSRCGAPRISVTSVPLVPPSARSACPQGARRIRKTAEPPTAAQSLRAAWAVVAACAGGRTRASAPTGLVAFVTLARADTQVGPHKMRKADGISVGADAHLGPNIRTGCPQFPYISVGAGVHDGPSKSTPHLYISHRQRQRRRRRDDTTFKAPCITLPTVWHAPQRPERYGARKGFQNLGFGGVFCILFAAAGKKYVAEGSQGLPPHPLTDAARMPYNIP